MSPKCLVAVVLSVSLFAGTLPAIQASLIHTRVSAHRSDASITTTVKARISGESDIRASDIGVETDESVVYLDGLVPTITEKAVAERIARSCDGVRDVVNRLGVLE